MNREFSIPLKTDVIEYTVVYADGLKERYVASYAGNVDVVMEQRCETPDTSWPWTGSIPECRLRPGEGRGCSWRFRLYILRTLAMINRAGEQFPCKGGGFEVSPPGCDVADWLGWHEQTCGEPGAVRDNRFAHAVERLKSCFDGVVVVDSEVVLDYFRYYLRSVVAVSRSAD